MTNGRRAKEYFRTFEVLIEVFPAVAGFEGVIPVMKIQNHSMGLISLPIELRKWQNEMMIQLNPTLLT